MKKSAREKRLDLALQKIAAILLLGHPDTPKTRKLLAIIKQAFRHDHPTGKP